MTPWEFQARLDHMSGLVDQMDKIRADEKRANQFVRRVMWGAAAFNLAIGTWNVVTAMAHLCGR